MTAVSLGQLRGVGEATEKKLRLLGIGDSEELLNKLPKQYIDLSVSVPIEEACDGSFCLFDAVVVAKSLPRRKGRLSVFTAEASSGGIPVRLTWFNHAFAHKTLQKGETYTFFGKLRVRDLRFEFNNPHFEKKTDDSRFKGVCPIYATKGLIGQGAYRNIVLDALNYCHESIVSPEFEKAAGLMSLPDAYRALHAPTVKNNSEAVRRVALELLTERIAAFRLVKKNSESTKKHSYASTADFGKIMKNLDYSLTESQSGALERITGLMRGERRMNAVLCGDVGSGKTVVAALAAYFAAVNGYQSAVAVPTELLAEQHFAFFKRLFAGTGVAVRLLTGGVSAAEKKEIYRLAERGEVDLVVGTHAVFSQKLRFARLALAIADEQHRFGVAQRSALIDKGTGCDVLTLSATPIPRTMCLAAYGEAEFITIDRRFGGNVRTSLVPPSRRADMFGYLAKRCADGAKIYLIAPRISDAEGIEKENCEELYKEACRYMPKEKIGLMHGKLKAEEKSAAMEAFRTGEKPVLVATTVVEVGVDVQDATIMVIADADCFGLAALHQLRGRVGRNGEPSYCFLCAGKDAERLNILTSSDDGFEIAEKDFDRRGGGEIFGLEQSGAGSVKILDVKLLKAAKEAAESADIDRHKERLSRIGREFCLEDVTMG